VFSWPPKTQVKQDEINCLYLTLAEIKKRAPWRVADWHMNEGHYKVEEVLKEHTTDTGRHQCKIKWVGYTDHQNSWVAEEDLYANHLLEQFQACRSSAATDGVRNLRNTTDSVQAGRGK